jgi:hypothetical protein
LHCLRASRLTLFRLSPSTRTFSHPVTI